MSAAAKRHWHHRLDGRDGVGADRRKVSCAQESDSEIEIAGWRTVLAGAGSFRCLERGLRALRSGGEGHGRNSLALPCASVICSGARGADQGRAQRKMMRVLCSVRALRTSRFMLNISFVLRLHLPISASLSRALDTIIVASALDILPVAALAMRCSSSGSKRLGTAGCPGSRAEVPKPKAGRRCYGF